MKNEKITINGFEHEAIQLENASWFQKIKLSAAGFVLAWMIVIVLFNWLGLKAIDILQSL